MGLTRLRLPLKSAGLWWPFNPLLSQIDGRSDGTVRRENLDTGHIEARIWDSPRYGVCFDFFILYYFIWSGVDINVIAMAYHNYFSLGGGDEY